MEQFFSLHYFTLTLGIGSVTTATVLVFQRRALFSLKYLSRDVLNYHRVLLVVG